LRYIFCSLVSQNGGALLEVSTWTHCCSNTEKVGFNRHRVAVLVATM